VPVPASSLVVVRGLSAPAPSRGALSKAKKLLQRAFIHRSSVFWKTRAFIQCFVVVGLWWVSLVLEEALWRAIAYHSWRYAVVCLIFDS